MSRARVRLAWIGCVLALAACGGSDSAPPPGPGAPPAVASLAFAVQPGAVVAGEVLAPAVDVAVLDAHGVPVTTSATVSLALSAGGVLRGTASAVAIGGHAVFADLSIREAGSGYTLTASSNGVPAVASAPFAVGAAAPDAATSDFVASPTTVVAGTAAALAATVRDAFGNAVPGCTVAFEATGTANTVVAPAGRTSAAGVATGSLSSTCAEEKTLTARASGLALSARPVVTVTAGAPDPAGSTLVAAPSSAVDDGTPIALGVTVGDRYGNPVAGQTVALAASGDPAATTVTQPSTTTSGSGATSGTVSALTAGTYTLSAYVGATLVAQRDVTFTAAPADAGTSTVVAAPASVPADGSSTAAVTVTVKDSLGRPVAGAGVALAGAATIAPSGTATTDGAGVAVFTVSSTTSGLVAFTATANPGPGAVVLGPQVSVTFSVPAVAGVAVTSAGNATVINGIGSQLQLTAAVTPSAAPQSVTWSSSALGIATVDQNGLVTANGLGEVTLSATATGGVAGTLKLIVAGNGAVFVKQGLGTASASLTSGTISAAAAYSSSGNAFKYANTPPAPASGWFYGTNSNGFVSLPYTLSGDFTMTATVSIPSAPKANTASGIGMGITTGFSATDRYAYVLLPTSGQGSARYVNRANNVTGATPPTTTSFAIPTVAPLQLTFSRAGSAYTLGIVGAGGTSAPIAATSFTDGTTVFGTGPVYPCISFNNVNANITSFVIKDGAGYTLFDSSTGTLQPYTPASLTLSAPTAMMLKGQSATVTATAIAGGGATATASAVASDPTVVDVSVANGASSSTVTLHGLKAGSATVTVTNDADPNPATNTKTVAVTVEEFGTSDAYGSIAARVYPAPGATAAYADGELSLTFDGPPVLNAGGSIDVYNLSDGSLADRIFFAGETQVVAGVTINVGSQLARVSGNTVFFTPHFGKLAYGASYYVGISTTAITGTLNGTAFAGLSNLSSVATWSFTTRPAPTLGTTIAVDGVQSTSTADFRTLGGALMYLAAHPVADATAVQVDVAPGTYIELVNYRATPNPNLTITISGKAGNLRGDDTVIQYTNGGAMNPQNGRASFYFAGANLVLQNLTFKNTGVRSVVTQAEALYFDSRAGFTLAANNCTFSSNQDTIQTSGRAWIYNSNIEGNTDFIWGTSDAALFESCSLRVINDSPGQTYSMFVARTGTTGASAIGKGYVLLNSTVSVDAGISAAYGRDAGVGSFYDQVALVNNTFTGGGSLAAGLWTTSTAPLSLGDSTYVGWKASGNTGLGADTATTATGTAATIASVATEYDTRDHILNRVVTVSAGAPTGYADASSIWDTSGLAAAWGAP